MEKFRIEIRQLDDDTFRRECERIEREQRTSNAICTFFVLLGMVIALFILAECGVSAESFRLPWSW